MKYTVLNRQPRSGEGMKIREILEVLQGEILVGAHDLDEDVPRGGAADLMSDVLAFSTEGMLLVTGLTNPQVVRTAEMAGISLIVLVRDKIPPRETLELARDCGITLMRTGYTMFEGCGRLYAAGLPGRGVVKIRDRSW